MSQPSQHRFSHADARAADAPVARPENAAGSTSSSSANARHDGSALGPSKRTGAANALSRSRGHVSAAATSIRALVTTASSAPSGSPAPVALLGMFPSPSVVSSSPQSQRMNGPNVPSSPRLTPVANAPTSPPQGSEHGSSQDGSQGQEAASQDSFSSYIHKNANIVASSSSQSSDAGASLSPERSPQPRPLVSSGAAVMQEVLPARQVGAVGHDIQGPSTSDWPSPTPSTRSAALARHFADSSQVSNMSASSDGLGTEPSFSFSSVSQGQGLYPGDDTSLTAVGSFSDTSLALLNKVTITSNPSQQLLEHDVVVGPVLETEVPASQPSLLEAPASVSSFVRQTSFRTFMGDSWTHFLQAQNQAAASALAPVIPPQARTIVGKKRSRAALEDISRDGSILSTQSSSSASTSARGTKDQSSRKVLTETDATAELRGQLLLQKSKAGQKVVKAATTNRRKQKSSKTAAAALPQNGLRGYRALTLHTSHNGRAMLGMKVRPFETVSCHFAPGITFGYPLPPLSPPLEKEGIPALQVPSKGLSSRLEGQIPVELRKSLRGTGLLAAQRIGEGDFSFGSVQEWAHSTDSSCPSSPEIVQSRLQGSSIIRTEHHKDAGAVEGQETALSLFASDQDQAKAKAKAVKARATPASPAAPSAASLGLLKPHTPSKAQYVFTRTKYGSVLGRFANVAPLRCASAPAGLSLQAKKKASAFTSLRVLLEAIPEKTGKGKKHTSRRYRARGFCRTPSLDAVMQRGNVMDRDKGHAGLPTPPKKKTRRARPAKAASQRQQIRASTPPLSPSKRVAILRGGLEEVDELESNSEGESDEDPVLARMPASGKGLRPAVTFSEIEGDDNDGEDDDEDDAARFALSSDNYEDDGSGVSWYRIRKRFGGGGGGSGGSASYSGMPAAPDVIDSDGFRRPMAPVGAGAAGSAQRRSHEVGAELSRSFSRSSSSSQADGHGRSWEEMRGYSGAYGQGNARPFYSAERGSAEWTDPMHMYANGSTLPPPPSGHPAYPGQSVARSSFLPSPHVRMAAGNSSQGTNNGAAASQFSRSTTLPSAMAHGSVHNGGYPDRFALNSNTFRRGYVGGSRPPVTHQAQHAHISGAPGNMIANAAAQGRAATSRWTGSSGSATATGAPAGSKKRSRQAVWEDEQQETATSGKTRHPKRQDRPSGAAARASAQDAQQVQHDENQPLPTEPVRFFASTGAAAQGKMSRHVSAPSGVNDPAFSAGQQHRVPLSTLGGPTTRSPPQSEAGSDEGLLRLSASGHPAAAGSSARRSASRPEEIEQTEQAAAEVLLTFGQGRE
ncbi:hypothetical protein OC846_005165 [Tilletia horrida]|uniref:Uncharacterized protein n=1 Tax=Tilletia horrida TaxID=155126 RepID=A0AAN6JPS5_9BASI|nr:hypothetical protein OC846_005165 [Tilletia horrida]KAK0563930.1 hypothetical protein OC861_004559 [Tilletia horrida]